MIEALQQLDSESEVASEVRARRFTLVDRRGNARAELGIGGDGAAGIRLFDVGEQARASLAVDPNGAAHLKLHNEEGEVCAWFSVDVNGSPSVYLCGVNRYDRTTKGHAGLSVDDHGAPSLSLHDKHGQPRVLLSLGEQDGTPVLSFSDAEGRLRALLSDDAEGRISRPPEENGHDPTEHQTTALPLLETDDIIRSVVAPELQAVMSRLDQAERRGRRARRTGGALAVVAVAALAFAASRMLPARAPADVPAEGDEHTTAVPGHTVEMEEFVLKDKDGGTRARLATLPDGAPYLQLMGKDGKGFAEVAILPGVGTSLRLGDGRSLISAKVGEDGGSEVALYGKGDKARAALTVQPDGMPVLGFADEEGRVRAGLSLGPDGSPSLSLYDKDGLRAVLGSSAATSSLVLLNREGRVIYQAPH